MFIFTDIHHNHWLCVGKLHGANKDTTGPGHVINSLGPSDSVACVSNIWKHQDIYTDLYRRCGGHFITQ